jgi:alkanesulfonate monooxygenase SsuD/methylene tetrahydromethanopterin reductase-like flavin-dependent oxidoreductase (luciferase family)
MTGHSTRLDRLGETCQLWSQLFTHGFASLDGQQIVAHRLPLSPVPARPPRLMLGGGSRRILEMAGTYADHIDLNCTSRSKPLPRFPSRRDDLMRKLSTSMADVEGAVAVLEEAARSAGRRPADIRRSIMALVLSEDVLSEDAEALHAGLAETGLKPAECAYILPLEPDEMVPAIEERQRRLGLTTLFVPDGPHLAAVVRAAASVPA